MSDRILVVDDEEDVRKTLEFWLRREGYDVATAGDAEEAFGVLHEFQPSIVLTDVYMPGMSGLELLKRMKTAGSGVDVVVVTGREDMETAVEATREGAYDYLPKPLDPETLERVLSQCLEDRRDRKRAGRCCGTDPDDSCRGRLIGTSPAMLEIYKTVGRVSTTRAPVLIRGETGTGKEVIARAIHDHSEHAGEPFVAVNCTAVPDQLLESELFGHLKGSFTGAVADRKGRFELAGKGTIFLDEIGDTAPSFQAKLLRVLQEGEFYPVGAEQPRTTAARVIAATHRPIEDLVESGDFREDLYFRLRVVEIRVPPLRDRAEDVPALARHFLARASEAVNRSPRVIPPDVMRALQEHDWRGNVRQLENAISRAVVMAEGGTIRVEHLGIGKGDDSAGDDGETLSVSSLDDAERRQVVRVLERTGGNKRQSARILEISRPRLDRLIKKYDIEIEEFTGG